MSFDKIIKIIFNFFTTGDQLYEKKTLSANTCKCLCANFHAWTGNFTHFSWNLAKFEFSAQTSNAICLIVLRC